MYTTLLTVHSVVRWLVVLAGLATVVEAFRNPLARRPGLMFVVMIDTQALIGLTLYFFLSPITQAAMQHMDAAMTNHVTRFWAIEHPFGMLLALAFVHVGRVAAKAAAPSPATRRRAAIFFALALAVVLFSIPWPFLSYGRPLL